MKQFSIENLFSRAAFFLTVVLLLPFCGVFAQSPQIFTTPGTNNWTVPYGVTSITVETWGAGGAGGGSAGFSGGGGGGGGYNTTTLSVTYGTVYSYTVGAGGTGSTGSGTNGGASSFNSTAVANGGVGGVAGTSSVYGTGGAGGTGNKNGGTGGTGISASSGGGGGSAGNGSNGGNGGAPTAGTAGTAGSGTAGAAGAAGVSSNSNGAAGTVPGSGGSAGRSNGKSGGAGANGQVKITYTQTCLAPPAQPTSLILSSAATTSITGNFTGASYTDGYLVVRTTTASAPTNPTNGTTYIAGNTLGSGTVVSSGATTSFTASSLTALQQYWFWVYGYNNSPCTGGITYLTTSPLSANGYTLCSAPSAQATSLTFPTVTYNSISGSYTPSATADGYLVIEMTSNTTVTTPTNGTSYTVGTSALGGTVVQAGAGTTFTSNGLSANTQYWYTVFAMKFTSCYGPVYRTATPLKSSTTTALAPCVAPTAQPTSLVLTPAAAAIAGSFTAEPSAYGYLVVRTTTASAPSNPVDGTTYTAGNSALGGLIIYAGTATTFNSASLTAHQQYWYWVYSYNDVTCSGGIKYYTPSPLTGSSYTTCATPSAQATSLNLTPGSYNISGSFTASGSADSYLVIRMTSNTAPTSPTDGTIYTAGTTALGGYVVSAGAATSFNDTPLSSSTGYWYTIFAYNSGTCSVPAYRTGTPLKANTTTLTPPCSAPASQPTSLNFSNVYSESLTGSFTATTADGYLVVRTTTSSQPSNPVNATTYTAGTSALGGVIAYSGAAVTWNSSTPLTAGTTYWYWIYAYNNTGCTGGPMYLTTSPLSSSVTTAAAGTFTNTATITTPGNATYSWKTGLTWSLGHLPTSSEKAELILNNAGTSADAIIVDLDTTITVYSYTMTNTSAPANYRHVFSTTGNFVFTCLNDMTLTSPGGHKFNRTVFCNLGGTYIYGNLTLGRYPAGSTDGHASIGSTGSTPNQTFTMYGDMIFNPRGYTTDEWAKFVFDKAGTQTIYNNTVVTDTVAPVLFEQMVIGQTNATTVIFAGSAYDSYIENVRAAGVTMGANTVLDLPNGYSLTKFSGGFAEPFIMGAGARLRLGGDKTMDRTGLVNGITGSNFPSNFSPYTFDNTSTVEYYGSSSITQTIYNGVTYGNLLIKNGPGTGRAAKINTAAVTANTSINVNALADWTLGSTVASAGPFNVNSTGGLYCATNTVSGAGAFTLASGGYLGMGSPNGITSGTTASGNIQMTGGRSFSTGGNYIYNGTAAQVTGNGLPTTCNDLYADNPTTVTIANSQIVTGLNKLAQGTFDIGSTRMTISGNGTMSSTGGKMKANAGILEMAGSSGTAQTISGSWFVNRNISTLMNSNTTGLTFNATAGDTVLIASALLYGTGTTNSVITTNNNLTLLSRDTATARFGQIVSGSGNSITGNVNVERYVASGRKWRLMSWPTTSTQTAKQAWMENNAANANGSAGYGTIVTDDKTTWSANGFDSRSVSGPSLKYYDVATGTFKGITDANSFQMNSKTAYFNFIRGDRSCTPANSSVSSTIMRTTGTLKTGNQSFTINANKVEAVGNPYASAVDLRLLDTTNVTGTYYVWDPKLTGTFGLGAYQTLYSNAGHYRVMPGGGSYGALNSIVDTIESGQAFFAGARSSNATITFKESAKAIGVRTMYRDGSIGEAAYSMLSLVDPGSTTLVDGTMCQFGHAWSNAVDYDDAIKLVNTSENVSYKRSGQLLSIEKRQKVVNQDTLFINMTGMRIHAYQWDIILDDMSIPGRTVLFVDKYLNTTSQLEPDATNTIEFDVVSDPASYAPDRFMIILKQTQELLVPVRFTSISAVRNADKTVTVRWDAENEIGMQNYDVQYSADGVHFNNIGSQAPTNNNGGSASYTFLDGHATANANYYRIRGNSLNGLKQYTAIVKVNPLGETNTVSIYPNPVTDNTLNLYFNNQPKGTYIVRVTNKLGQTLHTETIQLQTSNTVKMVKFAANAAPGSYQVTLTDAAGKMNTIPFMIK